jgi:hypothetical protein
LIGAGIDPLFVDTLPQRAGAFMYAAAKYQLVTNSDPEVSKLWKEESPKGYDLQRNLLKDFAFAYRKNKELTKAVAKIREGRGHRDMILDLLALHILGLENPGPLAKMPMFDAAKVQEAKTMHDRLNNLFARMSVDPDQADEAKAVLNRAYTYYKQAADEVKDHGQFVFENTDRYKMYVSQYLHSIRKSSSRNESAATETQAKSAPTA